MSPPAADVRRAFIDGLKQGRKSTAAGDHAAAITAFDGALAAIPRHPRALAGRGYARLLAGDLAGAEADLEAALLPNPPAKLRAAIYFNLGLVAEKRGATDDAESWFRRADQLRPSKAARAKLRGTARERACSFVDRRGAAGQEYVSWAALHAAMQARDREAENTASDDCRTPCFGGCEGEPPWSVAHGRSWALVTPRADGRLHAIVLPDPYGTSCEEEDGALDCTTDEHLTARGGVVHFAGKQRTSSREHFFDCEGEDAEDCHVVQWNNLVEHVDLLFAGEPLRLIAQIRRESEDEAPPKATVTLVDGRVEVRGDGCELDIPPTGP